MGFAAEGAVSSTTTAWFTLAGVIGGLAVGLLRDVFTQRWQRENAARDAAVKLAADLREKRWKAYADYLRSAQTVHREMRAVAWQVAAGPQASLGRVPPAVQGSINDFEAVRVEALLIASRSVAQTIRKYNGWLGEFLVSARRGEVLPTEGSPYEELISALRSEITAQAPT